MLDQEFLSQISAYTSKLAKPVFLRVSEAEHPDKAELMGMLEGLASTSSNIKVSVKEKGLRSGISFGVSDSEDNPLRVLFSGIPGGHEFNSLLLAILYTGGIPMKLDESLQEIAKRISHPLKFETIVSLSCHNCPDVVQALNQLAILNPKIQHEMIDGGPFPELIEERKIQSVPAVYLNEKIFSNGKMEVSTIIERVLELYPMDEKLSVNSNTVFDVTIIGGGPAGVSAAIYSARKGLNVLMIADRVGGQVKDTMDIENLISIPKTTGPKLVNALEEHLNEYKVSVRKNLKVKSITSGEVHKVLLTTGEEISTKTLVLATGAKWRELGVLGERENIGNGVAYCPHCDGPFFKDKDVIVVGGGNSGVEAALDLSHIVKSVTIVEYAPVLKADQVLLNRLEKTDNIRVLKNIESKSIETSNGKVSQLVYKNRETGETHTIDTAGIFIQIGLVPNSEFVKGEVELSKYGEILVDSKCRTNVKGIFACGDVTNVPYKQIIISMGEGAKAALSAFEYLMMET